MFPIAANRSDEEGQLYVDDVFSTSLTDNNLYKLSMDIAAPNPDISLTGFEIYSTTNRIDTSNIAVDPSGNRYIVSYIAPAGKTQISKYDASNNLLWTRSISEGGRVFPKNLMINADGSAIYIVCYTHRSTFDYYTLWVKYDSSGTLQAHKQIEKGDEYNAANTAILDSSENTYIFGNNAGTLGYMFLYKISSSGALTYQKRYYHATDQDTEIGAPYIDGSSIWVVMRPAKTRFVYEAKIVKISQSTGAIEAQYAVSGDTGNTRLSLFVDASYLYIGVMGGDSYTQFTIAKVSKTNPNTIYSSKTLSSRWHTSITPINVIDGNIYAMANGGGLIKFDSNLNIIGHLQYGSGVNTWLNASALTAGFAGSNIILSSGYPYYDQASGYNRNFILSVPNTFTGYATFKMDDRNEFVKLNIKETAPISVSFVTGTALTVDNDSASIGNSTATFSSTDYITKGNSVAYSSQVNKLSEDFLMWVKLRDTTTDHLLISNVSGVETVVNSNNADAKETQDPANYNTCQAISAIGRNFIVSNGNYPGAGGNSVGWVFRKAAKFFDVVTWTGNSSGAYRTISHNLGSVPGMIITKASSTTNSWWTYHRSTSDGVMALNTTAAKDTAYAYSYFGNDTTLVPPTSTEFTVGYNAGFNNPGQTYVAYLFAHDTSSTGIIQCGSFTTDGSGNATVNLGWEPQFLLRKVATDVGNWNMWDTMRGFTASNSVQTLVSNLSNEEFTSSGVSVTSTGFIVSGFTPSVTAIYMAIRRPNKPPTSGAQVFSTVLNTGNGTAGTILTAGFPVDLNIGTIRTPDYSFVCDMDRLRGATKLLQTGTNSAEGTDAQGITSFANQTGVVVGTGYNNSWPNQSPWTYVNWMFKRAPGFFDEVCFTASGSNFTVTHNLGAVPDLVITKKRSGANGDWNTYASPIGNTKNLVVNATSPAYTLDVWQNTTPTSTSLFLTGGTVYFDMGETYVAYLFATLAGISKVGSYTGNGSTQNIECGFAAGARFVLIKRTDAAGDWYTWDTARGIVTGNDPHLSLNNVAAEVTTDDSIDPYSPGFTVNQVAATNINVTSATYIFLAIA